MPHLQKKTTNRGYTLLFAVLVSSLVLAVGISILNISKKEFLLATSTRDSSLALYAADGGMECAILNEVIGIFDTAAAYANSSYDPTARFSCYVPHNTVAKSIISSQEGTFTFHAKFSSTVGGACAIVSVEKKLVSGKVKTIIRSRGYNTGWKPSSNPLLSEKEGTCSEPSPKRVERLLNYSLF